MSEAPVVKVAQGELQGKLVTSPSGKGFYTFLGIPYAKPPIGSLRFRAPQPADAWEGVREATSEGNSPAQVDPFFHKCYVGDENCLYLNVFTPSIEGEFLPVMVYVHGGGFRFGSGSPAIYGGDYLVEKDVVVVTINYRCGPLGFLCLNTPEVPGNAGLKDMALALKWVKENIKSFGGNASNVTVFGQSAGAVSAALLTASPLTKNIISKVIIQSGSALSSWSLQSNPVENAIALANELGCETTDLDEIVEFLETTPVKDIVIAHENTSPLDKSLQEGKVVFGPVIEKEFPGVEAFLTEPFSDILTSGRTADVPIMVGSVTLEMVGWNKPVDNLQDFIPKELNIERDSPESLAIAKEIEKLYFNGKNPTDEDSARERYQLMSDYLIGVAEHRYLQHLTKVTNKPVYYYKFDYSGDLNRSKITGKNCDLKCAAHSDDLDYLFKSEITNDVEPTTQDIKMRERMLRLWTNFAKEGNPTPEQNHYINVTWAPYNKEKHNCLILGNELILSVNPDQDKMEFWEGLYDKYYKIWDHPKSSEEKKPEEVAAPVCEVSVETESEDIPKAVEDTPAVVESHTEVVETSHNEVVESHVTVVETFVTKEHTSVEEHTTVEENTNVVENNVQEVVDVPDNKVPEKEPPKIVNDVKENNGHVEKHSPVVLPEESINVQEKIANHEQRKASINGAHDDAKLNGNGDRKPRPSNEIKMVQPTNFNPKDVIRANDPPEDDLPKNIGVNKFVNFFESLGGKK
ncbi:esterase E4-like isoform X2 [Aricia agestis]|nr:esterase E4-like isoform X2 [Aricia agestis]